MSLTPLAQSPNPPASLADAFTGTFERPKTPALYQVGLAVAALAMILLPLVYIGIIAAAAYGVYLQATDGFYIGSRGLVQLITYLTPIVAGSIVVFFMIKPLLARPAKGVEPLALDPSEEPQLHAFVQTICGLVGSSAPREIRVDCQANASASFRRGLLSFGGDDLVLTIGLPLAAGLRADQLAGVLAHEFGHFAQGAGMRLSYLVRSIVAWFQRVVYERDEWDVKLERWSENTDWRIAIALWVARLGVWVSRKILYGLMMTGLAVSSFLLRQMEFDADLYETRLAGSKTFGETSMDIELLAITMNQALSQISQFWEEGRLVDDIPGLTAALHNQVTDETRDQLRTALEQTETGKFDTHPATKDRMAAAQAEDATGVFDARNASSELFRDFERLCQQVTDRYYRAELGLDFDAANTIGVTAALARGREEQREAEITESLTGGLLRFSHPMRLPEPRGLTREEAVAEMAAAKADLERNLESLRPRVEKFDEAWDRRHQLNYAEAVLRSGKSIDPASFNVSGSSAEAIDTAVRDAEKEMSSHGAGVVEARDLVQRRFAAAQELAMAAAPDVAAEWSKLRLALDALASAATPIAELNREVQNMYALLENRTDADNEDDWRLPLENMARAAQARIDRAVKRMGDTRYPLEHADSNKKLADYLQESAGGSVIEAGSAVANRATQLYFRVVNRLAAMAHELESSSEDRAQGAGRAG